MTMCRVSMQQLVLASISLPPFSTFLLTYSQMQTIGDMKTTPPPPDHVTQWTRPLPAMTHRYGHIIRSYGSVICRKKIYLTELVQKMAT